MARFDPVSTAVLGAALIAGIIALGLTRLAWRNRDTPAATAFGWLILAEAGWCLLYALVLSSSTAGVARFWDSVLLIAQLASAFLWLVFVLDYTGYGDRLTPRVLALVWSEPVLYYGLALTNPYHGLVWSARTVESVGSVLIVSHTYGPAGTVHLAYAYLVLLGSFGLLGWFLVRTRSLYRRQAGIIFLANSLPLVGSVVLLVGTGRYSGLDPTPIFFVADGIIIAWALFRYDFLDVAPLASDVLIEEMDDGVIVVDEQRRVVDHNAAVGRLLGSTDDRPIGRPLDAVVPGLSEAIESREPLSVAQGAAGDTRAGSVRAADDGRTSEDLRSDGGAEAAAVYDPQLTPIYDHHDVRRGEIVVLRDITRQKRRENAIEALQSGTQLFMEAETRTEVAEIAVETAEEVLDNPQAGILFHDSESEQLRSVAQTSAAEELFGQQGMVLDRSNELAWGVFESGEMAVFDSASIAPPGYGDLPIESALLYSLGSHGLFGIGSEEPKGNNSIDDLRFARVLVAATETALDRTEREAELRASRATIAEQKEQIEFFNGVLRHDVLNGMNVVEGYLGLLDDHVDEEGERYVEIVTDWSSDITHLIRKVRSVIDAVATDGDATLESTDLAAALERKTRKIERSHEDVEIDAEIPDRLPVRGDEFVGEVIENVLLNAIEHNDGDRPRISIRVETDDAGEGDDTDDADETNSADGRENSVRVRIADDGPGVSDELKERVFERAFTSEHSGSIGFGLYFVKIVMERYGGAVRFEDNDPRGAVAVLEFVAA
jgi:signal transduction histidine kinase/PAS domain-containing protein